MLETRTVEKKNKLIPVISCATCIVTIIAVLFLYRQNIELKKELSEMTVLNKKESEIESDYFPSKMSSATEDNISDKEKIKKLEFKIANMQAWQNYLEKALERESLKKITNEERDYKDNKSRVTSRFDLFFERNDLSPDKKEEFIELLTQQELEFQQLLKGMDDVTNMRQEADKIQSNYNNLISNLLTEEDYIAYQKYLKEESDRMLIKSFKRNIFNEYDQLNKQQERDLADAFNRKRQDILDNEGNREAMNKGGLQSKEDEIKMITTQLNLYKGYIEVAKDILTDSQMERFKEYMDLRISSTKLLIKQRSLMLENKN